MLTSRNKRGINERMMNYKDRKELKGLNGSPTTITSKISRKKEGFTQTTTILHKINKPEPQLLSSLPNMKYNLKVKRMIGRNHLLMKRSNQGNS